MTIQSKEFEPDLEALADNFSAMAAADADTALSLWNATAPLLSDDLRSAWAVCASSDSTGAAAPPCGVHPRARR